MKRAPPRPASASVPSAHVPLSRVPLARAPSAHVPLARAASAHVSLARAASPHDPSARLRIGILPLGRLCIGKGMLALVRLRVGMFPLAALLMAGLASAADQRRSGADYMSAATQAMQRDDAQNPAMLWISGGEAQWRAPAGSSGKSCAGCHDDARNSMRGVATRYPAFDQASGKTVNLAQRINLCRERRQKAAPWKAESEELLSMEAYIAMQSRGMPMAPPQDTQTRASATRGQQLYFQRIGQLNLSCAQCHDQHASMRLAASTIPQAHAAAYPIYRLEWQSRGKHQPPQPHTKSRVRPRMAAEAAQEFTHPETMLAVRDRGMTLETPGVRP
jgi:sulfur-oxidizing protein SoxA